VLGGYAAGCSAIALQGARWLPCKVLGSCAQQGARWSAATCAATPVPRELEEAGKLARPVPAETLGDVAAARPRRNRGSDRSIWNRAMLVRWQ